MLPTKEMVDAAIGRGSGGQRPGPGGRSAGRGGGRPAGRNPGYRHHERYRGDYYNYPDHQEPYWEDGPYDGYYHCWRQPDSKGNPETWCDHYWGRRY